MIQGVPTIREIPVADWLTAAARRQGDKNYLEDLGQGIELTYSQVDDRVRRLANALHSRGVGKGDKIALWATDSHRLIEALWACMRLGVVFVPLNPRLTAREVENFVRIAGARMIFASADYVERSRAIGASVDSVEAVIAFEDDAADGYDALLASGSTADIRIDVADQDSLGLAFTSGTTGLPKAVMQSQRMLKWVALGSAFGWEMSVQQRYYSGISFFHISGIAVAIASAYLNCTLVLTPGFQADTIVDLLEQGQLTGLILVPSMVSMVVEKCEGRGPFTSLRTIHYGASAMPVPVIQRAVATFGCDFSQAFGAGTESGSNCYLTIQDHRRALAGEAHLLTSVGRPAPGVELRICDDDWNDVGVGAIGEVVVRSDQIMAGYADNPEESLQALHPDGWFRAGDLGYRDADGFVFLVERKKNMIIRGGENIYPAEIERVIYEYPGVLECAVVGQAHEKLGEVPVAHVVFRTGVVPPASDELTAFCAERIAAFKVPRSWTYHSELPKNATGKILKRELKQETP